MVEKVRLNMHERGAWEKRIGEQINFGDAALKEATRNLDFPPAALFFLQTAHAYYLTALADCLKQSVMSLLTRPMAKVRRMSAETGFGWRRWSRPTSTWKQTPRPRSRRLSGCMPPRPPRGSPRQFQAPWRKDAWPLPLLHLPAGAGVQGGGRKGPRGKGDHANANFFLRFWAYSLSRCPVVLEEARQGRETSFYVPFRPFKESVQAACPEILDDMETIFGGELTAAEARECVEGTGAFRGLVTGLIRERGLRPDFVEGRRTACKGPLAQSS